MNRARNVVVIEAAVWSQDGTVRLHPSDSPSKANVAADGSFEIKAVTLDSLIGRATFRNRM
jgi:hypothetical protein